MRTVSSLTRFFAVFLLWLWATAALASEAMVVGYLAPEYKGKRLQNVLVHARIDNAFFRDQLERRTAHAVRDESNGKTKVFLAVELFPPLREYSEAEIARKLVELEIDAVLFYDIARSDVAVSRGWYFSVGPGGGHGGTYTAATRYTKAVIELYEPSQKALVWKGEADLRVAGGSEKSIKRSTKYLAKRVAELFARDGLYPP